MSFSRRRFLTTGSMGLAVAGAAAWTLRPDAFPTPASGQEKDVPRDIAQNDAAGTAATDLPSPWKPTEDNILGPYYRQGSPFRGKVTPPLAMGRVLLISGRVWGFDTKKPLINAVLDIWQADHNGRYDNDDPANPPAEGVFKNRIRLVTDENGHYEYESIHPGAYQIGPEAWRPPHIHYLVQARGYERLVTQLYFRGDKHQDTDRFIKDSLIIDLSKVQVLGLAAGGSSNGGSYWSGRFDIVLAKAAG